MAMTLNQQMIWALDPVEWVHDNFDEIRLDLWQQQLLKTDEKRILLNVHRQGGKDLTTCLLAVHMALFKPRSLIIIISPSQRQSSETFSKAAKLLREVNGDVKLLEDSKTQILLANGSRIVSLPGTEGTVRGYSRVSLLILNECSRIDDNIIAAVGPFLATGDGTLVGMTTPFGKRGWFYEQWTGSGDYLRVEVKASQCPRITEKFLEKERKTLPQAIFRQEYECSFEDEEGQMFPADLIDAAFVPGAAIGIKSFGEWRTS